jgi:hypothetical protein
MNRVIQVGGALLGVLCLLIFVGQSQAMTSTNYEIRFDSVTSGGDDTSSSATYQVRDSVNSTAPTVSSSTTYQAAAGYRTGIYDRVADFSVLIQDKTSQVAASSISSTTVTVTSISGYAVGDYVALVQDEGASQVTAMGYVTVASGSDITVDAWTPSAPTIDGTNDYLYNLDGTTLALGTLSESIVTTAIIGWDVTVDNDDGYTVYLYEDGELLSGGNTVADVSDGTVTAGASEHGARSSDSSLASSTFDTADTGITTSYQEVATRGDNAHAQRDFITLKTAISSGQASGSYTQELYLMYVGDY